MIACWAFTANFLFLNITTNNLILRPLSMIPVTKPFQPPIQEYRQYLQDIWERNWLTNNGPLVDELKVMLRDYLAIKHLLCVTNGTIALKRLQPFDI